MIETGTRSSIMFDIKRPIFQQVLRERAQKQVLVLPTYISMTETDKKANFYVQEECEYQQISCTYYPT